MGTATGRKCIPIDYIKELVQPVDPELAEAIFLEKNRQNSKIELIASENFVSPAAMAAQGSVLTNNTVFVEIEIFPGNIYWTPMGQMAAMAQIHAKVYIVIWHSTRSCCVCKNDAWEL